MPDKPEPAASKGQPLPSSAPASVASAVEGARSNDPNLLSLVYSGRRVQVGFNYKEMPDETRVAKYRAQLLDFVQRTNCKSLTFDLKGLKILPSRMLGFFVSLKNEGHDIELLNMQPVVQEVFRITKLGSLFTIRPHSN